ncbi:MAG: glycosyltransferase involved in cell wall biosynthesis [Glaciecola sp.]|jgi:glycosyltransferase involved in cell wall biosynthesis
MKPKVIVSVSNDLVSDQRVHKSCLTLVNLGWEVLLVGRMMSVSLNLERRAYETKRMNLVFSKGALFYAEFNIRLFLFLLFKKGTVFHSNDLDTLPANYLASKFKSTKLVYDSHEYFTEVPELISRPKVQNIWKKIEGWILPNLKEMFTVNDSIATLFRDKYRLKVRVMRNMPLLKNESSHSEKKESLVNLPDQKIILLQGAGINIQRGAEELVEAMQFVNNAVLVIVGSGDVVPFLKAQRIELKLEHKISFYDKMPFEKLQNITKKAYLGCTLDKPTNINYELSLPNKLFDYIHAGVPVLASDLKEVASVVKQHEVGIVLKTFSTKSIAKSINDLVQDESRRELYHQNCLKARVHLNWENEEKELVSCYNLMVSPGK